MEINQEKLASTAGIAASYYSEIESGKKIPSLKTLVDIVNALGLEGVDAILKKKGRK